LRSHLFKDYHLLFVGSNMYYISITVYFQDTSKPHVINFWFDN
jgi:hypothetical protein